MDPGLLQTPEYARALISGAHPSLQDEDVAQRAEVRAHRQEVLAKKGAIYLRDTKDRTKPPHMFTPAEGDAFVGGVKDGEFDQ